MKKIFYLFISFLILMPTFVKADVAMPTPFENFIMKYGNAVKAVIIAVVIAALAIVVIKLINRKKK